MDASILITTRNRAQSLRATFAALEAINVPNEMTAEVVVIDNGSSDDTQVVTANAKLRNMSVRYVSEPRTGQCFARNAGVAAARGEVIVFTDDDVRPSADWLRLMCAPILAGEADAVGGAVRLAPHLRRPWMQPMHLSMLASTEALDLAKVGMLVGANMAFAAKVREKVPWFDVELGPGQLGFNDDGLFGAQLREAGYRLKFLPQAWVEHHPDESRLNASSFYNTAIKLGRSEAYSAYHWHHTTIRQARRRLLTSSLRAIPTLLARRLHPEAPPTENQLGRVKIVHFFRQYVSESKRARNYALKGLVKVAGSQWDGRAAAAAQELAIR